MKKIIVTSLVISSILISPFLVGGCTESYANLDRSPLSLVEPTTQQRCLDGIPVAKYKVKVKNGRGREETLEFAYPWYIAIGGKITNETGAYEQAAVGQVNYSTILGLGIRKYFLWSADRAKAIKVALRDPYDWNEMKKEFLEVGGRANIRNGEREHLPTLSSSLSSEMIEKEVWNKNIPPELFVTGALTEVTVGEESFAGGVVFAGIGSSTKVVQTSVAGSLEITDPYTGELLVSVMGQNRVSAYQIGIEAFLIVSAFGTNDKFLNAELVGAKEIIKQQVQVELVDFLFYKAFEKLYTSRAEYLTERLHYRVGKIREQSENLAQQKGLTVVSKVVPIDSFAGKTVPTYSFASVTKSGDRSSKMDFYQRMWKFSNSNRSITTASTNSW